MGAITLVATFHNQLPLIMYEPQHKEFIYAFSTASQL